MDAISLDRRDIHQKNDNIKEILGKLPKVIFLKASKRVTQNTAQLSFLFINCGGGQMISGTGVRLFESLYFFFQIQKRVDTTKELQSETTYSSWMQRDLAVVNINASTNNHRCSNRLVSSVNITTLCINKNTLVTWPYSGCI